MPAAHQVRRESRRPQHVYLAAVIIRGRKGRWKKKTSTLSYWDGCGAPEKLLPRSLRKKTTSCFPLLREMPFQSLFVGEWCSFAACWMNWRGGQKSPKHLQINIQYWSAHMGWIPAVIKMTHNQVWWSLGNWSSCFGRYSFLGGGYFKNMRVPDLLKLQLAAEMQHQRMKSCLIYLRYPSISHDKSWKTLSD